jgi:hypothetical protein
LPSDNTILAEIVCWPEHLDVNWPY